MKVAVFGMGYVGAVTAGCLARDGHEVWGVELQAWKVVLLRSGRGPVVERGLDDLICRGVAENRLHVTDSAQEAVAQAEVIFICVGTPGMADGSQDLRAVERVCEEIAVSMKEAAGPRVVVLRSTVLPGTTRQRILPYFQHTLGNTLELVFIPEFLREGSGIEDFDHPPYTIVGEAHPGTAEWVRPLFAHLPAPFLPVGLEEAEMMKFASNAFHATKITFANEIGRLCRAAGIDGRRVMELVAADNKLNASEAYLQPGFAFGGSCLPKDLRALLHHGIQHHQTLPMLEGILTSQEAQHQLALKLLEPLRGRCLGLWGVSFKSGTDDLRESPALALAGRLLREGFRMVAYDPNVDFQRLAGANRAFANENAPFLREVLAKGPEEFFLRAEAVVVASHGDGLERWKEALGDLPLVDLSGAAKGFERTCKEYHCQAKPSIKNKI